MKVQQILGWIYLLVFIGVLVYNFNYFISDVSESAVLMLLVLIVILILVLFIRKILHQ